MEGQLAVNREEGEAVSSWTHAICDACWDQRNPYRDPYRIKEATEVMCCFCGNQTKSGIWIRKNPADMICNGEHGDS